MSDFPFVDLRAQWNVIREDAQRRVLAVLDHGGYILGPEVVALEGALAQRAGVRHCIAASSGTDALLMALMALGVRAGDEVITTPFTFVATAEVVSLLGARPLFADIDPRTYNLDPAAVEARITPRTRAIIAVNIFGQCADYDALQAIADRHGIVLIEDAAQSFGAAYRGRPSGSLGRIAATSFYPAKPLGCAGDGGACFTDDDALATSLRSLRDHGRSAQYEYDRVGLNGRLDTVQAALLLAKLNIFDDELLQRAAVARRYDAALAGVLQTPHIEPRSRSVYAQYVVELDRREDARHALSQQGIPTAVYYPSPLHRQTPYLDDAAQCPRAEQAAQRVLALPLHPYLEHEQQDRVIAALVDFVGRA